MKSTSQHNEQRCLPRNSSGVVKREVRRGGGGGRRGGRGGWNEGGGGEGWRGVINIQNEKQESRAVPSDKYLALVPTPERLNSVINANLPAVPPTPYHPLRLLSRLCTYTREPEGGLKQALESILEFQSVYDSFWRPVKKGTLAPEN